MLNNKPVVLLDVDEVLAQCTKAMIESACQVEPVTINEWKSWDVLVHVSPAARSHVIKEMAREGWCYALEPFPEAIEGVERLHAVTEVFFVTAPFGSKYWHHEREAWIEKHFGLQFHHRTVQTNAKFLVQGNVFIDDKPDNCVKWAAHNKQDTAVLWDRPQNRNHKEDTIIRISSWEELFDFVRMNYNGYL